MGLTIMVITTSTFGVLDVLKLLVATLRTRIAAQKELKWMSNHLNGKKYKRRSAKIIQNTCQEWLGKKRK